MTCILNTTLPDEARRSEREKSFLRVRRRKETGDSDYKKKSEFEYEFTITEYVVENISAPGMIEFHLDTTSWGMPTDVREIYIHGFCCTRGDSMTPKKHWVGDDEHGIDETTLKFPRGTSGIAFEPKLNSKELINVGLIVAILKKGKTVPELILCDPQVGNGPPAKDRRKGSETGWLHKATLLYRSDS